MPFLMQMFGLAVFVIGIIFAVYLSIWLLLIMFGLALVAVIWSHLREFLIAKDILNPTPGIAPRPAEEADIAPMIEGDFTRVDEREPR